MIFLLFTALFTSADSNSVALLQTNFGLLITYHLYNMVQLSTFVVAVAATIATFASAAPARHEERSTQCSNPLVRKEWRQLNVLEKSNYLLSMKCMTLKPSKLKSIFPAAKTRWDDFISIHQAVTPQIHYVGQFLPCKCIGWDARRNLM